MMMARKQRDNGLFLYEREETPGGGGSSLCGVSSVKRLKTSSNERSLVASQTESFSSRERKDKFGERVVALQQLVSPYGKTDTASVLQEAADYIRFLHEQVQVLSSPYLQTSAMANRQGSSGHCSNLRNQGLCLVPLSHASGLAGNNGADIWAPMNTSTSPKF